MFPVPMDVITWTLGICLEKNKIGFSRLRTSFYPQLHSPFISHLSTFDALFNVDGIEELVKGFAIPFDTK